MLTIRLIVLSALVGIFSSIAMLAQTGPNPVGTFSASSDEQILNAPFSAKRRVTSVEKLADGTISRNEASESKARDSEGRTYSAGERHWTYFNGKTNVLGSEMLYRIEDPVARTETRWDTTSKVVKVIHLPRSVPKENEIDCQHSLCSISILNSGDGVERLGAKTIAGVVAEGTRSSYTIPAGHDRNEQSVVVVHEIWYCPELKTVILETNDDPLNGSSRDELMEIVRGEPDVTQYRAPADYVVRELQLPQ